MTGGGRQGRIGLARVGSRPARLAWKTETDELRLWIQLEAAISDSGEASGLVRGFETDIKMAFKNESENSNARVAILLDLTKQSGSFMT